MSAEIIPLAVCRLSREFEIASLEYRHADLAHQLGQIDDRAFSIELKRYVLTALSVRRRLDAA